MKNGPSFLSARCRLLRSAAGCFDPLPGFGAFAPVAVVYRGCCFFIFYRGGPVLLHCRCVSGVMRIFFTNIFCSDQLRFRRYIAFLQVFSVLQSVLASFVSFAPTASGGAHSLRCSSFQKHSRANAAGLVDNFGPPLHGCVFVNGRFMHEKRQPGRDALSKCAGGAFVAKAGSDL
ncbi:MAG: hypothetical protein IKQ10_01500 [Oscillospiraceae bacterium]|nr:hypothetical protein [Oscillospiraceae bacterium]